MAKNARITATDERDDLKHDFHPPAQQDERPVNLDGKPEEDFDPMDDSLFVHRRRY